MYSDGNSGGCIMQKEEREFICDAILSIRPASEFIVADTYDTLDWHSKDQDKPTEAEFDEALKTVKAEYDANQYQRSRASEYPSIVDQLDEIYHNGIDSWKAIIKQTKDKYQKG